MRSGIGRARLGATLTAALLLFLAMPGAAAAAEYRAGDRVAIGADETIDDDVYVAAGTTVVNGTINGDLTVASGTVDVRGTVGGSVNVAGGNVTVTGTVDGAVRSFGGNVTVSGEVGRDVVVGGGNVVIEEGATVGGDVAGGAGTLRIAGTVEGDILAGIGELVVEGEIGGGIDANVGRLRIGSEADIAGDVRYASEREAEVADGAQIGGEVVRREPDWAGYQPLLGDSPFTAFIGSVVGLLVLGWGLMLLRPGWVTHPGGELQLRPLLAFGAGLATWIGQFLLLVVLGILGALGAALATAFGGAFVVPFIIVMLGIVILLFLSQVYVAMGIGHLLGLAVSTNAWLAYAVGALAWAALLALLGWLLPALGAVVFFIGWVLGLGAFALDTLERRRRDTAGWDARAEAA